MTTKVFLLLLVALAAPLTDGLRCKKVDAFLRVNECIGCENNDALPLFDIFFGYSYLRVQTSFLQLASTLPDDLCLNDGALLAGAKKTIACLYAEASLCNHVLKTSFPSEEKLANFVTESCQLPDSDRFCFLAVVRSDRVNKGCDNFYGSDCDEWANVTSCVENEVKRECSDNMVSFYKRHVADLTPDACLKTTFIPFTFASP
ncbi:uncharacterized protein LOC101860320 [Aplysia californica]|uniref:Uncharacterized protein LOC101860320 n=1 Tax=Aplysia californica TaxID=6500 RepID=A0ABM0JL56_APLCA|nr:uncharacterized protein LOC101860320 [Aplysia californica]